MPAMCAVRVRDLLIASSQVIAQTDRILLPDRYCAEATGKVKNPNL